MIARIRIAKIIWLAEGVVAVGSGR